MTTLNISLTSESNATLKSAVGLTGAPNTYQDLSLSALKDSEPLVTHLPAILDLSEVESINDLAVASISYDEYGDFKKLISPSLHKGEGNKLVVKLGGKVYDLRTDNPDLGFSVEVTKVNGFKAICLAVDTEVGDEEVVMYLPMWLSDEAKKTIVTKDGVETSFNTRGLAKKVADKNFAMVASVLSEPKMGGDTRKIFEVFPEDTWLTVNGMTSFEGQYGTGYILNLSHDGTTFSVFAPYKVKALVEAGWTLPAGSCISFVTTEKLGKTTVQARCRGQVLAE